ncbi:MAG: hypothetical protein JWN76_2843 [Chitinophagaceae bacterium]|nr:hypothetical protein [Chitinophagaceae bacterium]
MESQLSLLLSHVESDSRLKAYHLVLYTSLVLCYVKQGGQTSFRISRSRLMKYSRIQSVNTYHKYMQDLVAYGYIDYIPSYHPARGTEICLKHIKTAYE